MESLLFGNFAILTASLHSKQKSTPLYPFLIVSAILNVGLAIYFARMTKEKNEELPPLVVEVELVEPELKEPPPFLPPGSKDGTTMESKTDQEHPSSRKKTGPTRRAPAQIKRADPAPLPSPDIKPPSPETPRHRGPKIVVRGLGSGGHSEGIPASPFGTLSSGEPGGGNGQDGSEREAITPLEQVAASLYQRRPIEVPSGDGNNGGGAVRFGQLITNRLRLDKKKKHYQIAFLIDRSGSMFLLIDKVLKQIEAIMDYAQDQLLEEGRVTFGVWLYMQSAISLKNLEPESGIAHLSKDDELRAVRQALARAVEIVETNPGSGFEYTWDCSIQVMTAEAFSPSDEIEKVLIVLTDDESACYFIEGLKQYCRQGAGDNSSVKVQDAARRHGIRYELIRRSN